MTSHHSFWRTASATTGAVGRVEPLLAQHYDIIAIDARGHGLSSDPPAGYGRAKHAADLAGLIATLELSKPIVMGHSMGAANALALAGLYPNLPKAIVLEDPPPFWAWTSTGDKDADEKRLASRHGWIIALKRKTRDEIIADGKATSPTWAAEEFDPWADAKIRLSLNVLNGAGEPVDWRPLARRVTCPALLITADPSKGALVTDDDATALATLIPQLQIAHIADAGHSIRREQFEAYMAAVNHFLQQMGD